MRKIIWDSMLDAEMNERYWSKLSKRYYKKEQRTKIFLAIMASGTVASWSIRHRGDVIVEKMERPEPWPDPPPEEPESKD